MTPADEIRLAAQTMRERAEKATANVCPAWVYQGVRHLVRNCDVECYHELADGECSGVSWDRYNDHEHIAAWTPAVALALAAWLDQVADIADRVAYQAHRVYGDDPAAYAPTLALNVARAYLAGAGAETKVEVAS